MARRDEEARWREQDSRAFLDLGRYFVPEREYQIRTICALIPPHPAPFGVLELGCGEGLLAEAILKKFPECTMFGLDGSEEMLRASRRRLARFDERFAAERFDLASPDWREPAEPVRAVVSSLVVHHLDAEQKRELFRDVYRMLELGGVFVIADLIEPATGAGVALAASSWDEAVRERSLALDGDTRAFGLFEQEEWNLYRHPDPEVDKPSGLYEQLSWLEEAGFSGVDVFWMKAGHAIFGGMKAEE